MYSGVHVNVATFLVRLHPTFNFPRQFFLSFPISDPPKWESFCCSMLTYGQTDMKLTVIFLQIWELAIESFMIKWCLWRLPATSEEMMRGRMNILRSLMRISPGKDTSIMDSSENWARRPRNPIITPTTTPPIVSARRMLVRTHCRTCK